MEKNILRRQLIFDLERHFLLTHDWEPAGLDLNKAAGKGRNSILNLWRESYGHLPPQPQSGKSNKATPKWPIDIVRRLRPYDRSGGVIFEPYISAEWRCTKCGKVAQGRKMTYDDVKEYDKGVWSDKASIIEMTKWPPSTNLYKTEFMWKFRPPPVDFDGPCTNRLYENTEDNMKLYRDWIWKNPLVYQYEAERLAKHVREIEDKIVFLIRINRLENKDKDEQSRVTGGQVGQLRRDLTVAANTLAELREKMAAWGGKFSGIAYTVGNLPTQPPGTGRKFHVEPVVYGDAGKEGVKTAVVGSGGVGNTVDIAKEERIDALEGALTRGTPLNSASPAAILMYNISRKIKFALGTQGTSGAGTGKYPLRQLMYALTTASPYYPHINKGDPARFPWMRYFSTPADRTPAFTIVPLQIANISSPKNTTRKYKKSENLPPPPTRVPPLPGKKGGRRKTRRRRRKRRRTRSKRRN